MSAIGFIKEETEERGTREVFPCVCCGYLVHREPPGSYSICEICFWEDDATQLRYPELAVGANHVCLVDAQKNFSAFGACEERSLPHVRTVEPDDQRDPEWRPVDPKQDKYERVEKPFSGKDYFDSIGATDNLLADATRLYYWRSTYWRR